MADTTFRAGEPMNIDYTPSSGNVASGEVVLLGNTTSPTCGIAPVAITNSTLGALSVGGGIYDVVNLNNSANYALVYWDLVNNTRKVTSVSTNNAKFGFIVDDGGGGANSTARALHWPFV
jgi:hypothetical protein